MSATVEILYGDLSIKKAALPSVGSLPLEGVLFILVKDDDEEGKRANVEMIHGFDHYAVGWRINRGQEWVMLNGWDDDDYVWRRIGCGGCNTKEQTDAPLGHMHVMFRGLQVDEKTWVKANRIFNKEMI